MIEKIQLRDFQKHKKLNITFTPGVNCITGATDAGKSSVIRALQWAVLNKPKGDAMTRHHKGKAKVYLKIDGKIIKRQKGKQNLYAIDDKEFKAFNHDVPPEVTKTINLSEVNFQSQFDPHFWFCETPGEVSRQLNKIIDLTIIDETLANLASAVREQQAKIKVGKQSEEKAQVKVESFNYLEDMNDHYRTVERLEQRLLNVREEKIRIHKLVEEHKILSNTIICEKHQARTARNLLRTQKDFCNAEEATTNLHNLIFDYKEHLEKSKKEIPDISKLKKLNDNINRTAERKKEFKNLYGEAVYLLAAFKQRSKQKENDEKELAKWNGKVCETCGQKIKIK